jgi:two-component system sensor histidine kinase KdpD
MKLLKNYGFAVAVTALATAICFLLHPHLQITSLVMVYLLGTLAVAARGHRGAAALSAASSVLCFDFFFVPPQFTFRVSDVEYFWTFLVMFVAAMIISHLTIRLQEEALAAREGEQRTAWLMEKAKQAEVVAETERLRSSLLSSVSHDFRTPLTAIVGSAGTLLAREELRKNMPVRELLENIQAEGERLSRLIQNLLEATRLESRTVEIQKEACPLEEVVGSALERVEKSLGDRKVTVAIPEELPLVPMDATLMEQVFVNLLENGARHTPPGTQLEITATHEGGNVFVSVIDEGPGLVKDDLEKVFDKFYHHSSSPGVGLGLAICRAIVNAHGGRIWAENKTGGGAIFRFTLPLEKKDGR